MENDKYTCHSGGAIGADLKWELEGNKYGVETIAYSFKYHKTESKNQLILSEEELKEGWVHILKANESLKRGISSHIEPYVYRLLCRNWFQVKNSDMILAIGELSKNKKSVEGGTGWAVQMALDNEKPVYVFDQPQNQWYVYLEPHKRFVEYYAVPQLTNNFAGIGTRGLNINGIKAIERVYERAFRTQDN